MISLKDSTKMQLVNYHSDYKDGILQLMSSVPYKGSIWQWQFEENPFGLTFQPIVITRSERVIGFNGAMPVKIIYNGELLEAMWSCDFYVHADCRGKGLGQIVKDKQFGSNSIIMALGLSDVATYVWRKKGCDPNTDICILRKYRKPDTSRKYLLVLFQLLEYVKGTGNRLFHTQCGTEIKDILDNKDEIERLWERVAKNYKKIVVRNYDYMHWRYEKHPLAKYQFVLVRRNKELVAIGVFRRYGKTSKFVDLLAASNDVDARLSLVNQWFNMHSTAEMYNTTTTDKLLIQSLASYGFYKTRDKAWFFTHSNIKDDMAPQQDWFIMPGDSDGEFLEAAENGFNKGKSDSGIRIEKVKDKAIFKSMQGEWVELLKEADVNELFLSWQWQYTWWEMWGDSLDLELLLLKAYQGDRLIGIAPLYIDNIRLRSGMKIRRMQFIGNAWHRQGTVRTEYLEFIALSHYAAEVCDGFVKYIADKKDWDEFIICDLQKQSESYRQILKQHKAYKWYLDSADTDKGVRIVTKGRFGEYVKNLGRNTRLKLFNRRKYLMSLGDVKCRNADGIQIDRCFSILNDFHRSRWGKPCFTGQSLAFHKALINRLNDVQNYSLSCIYLDGEAISLLYNLTAGNTVYNIQSGFNQTFNRKLSLGTLHMGYSIEEAFKGVVIDGFDLLAGEGKTEFYKKKYRGNIVDFVTLRVTRSRLLKMWYIVNNMTPENIKHLVSRMMKWFGK